VVAVVGAEVAVEVADGAASMMTVLVEVAVTPALSGVTKRLWDIGELVDVSEAFGA